MVVFLFDVSSLFCFFLFCLFQIGPNGYYFAIDPNGYVLLHPNLQPKVPKQFLHPNTSNMTSQHIYD